MDTRADDEQASIGYSDDDEQASIGYPDDELLNFRKQGIGADQCALSF